SSVRAIFATATGASGEMRSTSPNQYRSSMTSPTTSTCAAATRSHQAENLARVVLIPSSGTTDREVLDSRRARERRVVQVAPVEQQWVLEPSTQRFKVLTAEFLPFSHDDQRICAVARFEWRSREG